jgi:hypothetical protein
MSPVAADTRRFRSPCARHKPARTKVTPVRVEVAADAAAGRKHAASPCGLCRSARRIAPKPTGALWRGPPARPIGATAPSRAHATINRGIQNGRLEPEPAPGAPVRPVGRRAGAAGTYGSGPAGGRGKRRDDDHGGSDLQPGSVTSARWRRPTVPSSPCSARRRIIKNLVNRLPATIIASVIAALVVALNLFLVYRTFVQGSQACSTTS